MEETHKIEARQGNLTALFICPLHLWLHRLSGCTLFAGNFRSMPTRAVTATNSSLALAILQSCKAHYALSQAGGGRRFHQIGIL
jgi:hypothetical protein